MKLELTQDEWLTLCNILNDVAHGMPVLPSHEAAIGASRVAVTRLLAKVNESDGAAQIELSPEEASLALKAFEYAIPYLGEEEFQTRIGTDFAFGKAMLLRLRPYTS
jgi:hypothetical protein